MFSAKRKELISLSIIQTIASMWNWSSSLRCEIGSEFACHTLRQYFAFSHICNPPTPLTITTRVSPYYLYLLHPIKGQAGRVATCSPNFYIVEAKLSTRSKRYEDQPKRDFGDPLPPTTSLHYVASWNKQRLKRKHALPRLLILYQGIVSYKDCTPSKFPMTCIGWYMLYTGSCWDIRCSRGLP